MASVGETKELSESPKETEDKEGGTEENEKAEEAKKDVEVKKETKGEVRKPPERKERAAKREKAREKEREKEKEKQEEAQKESKEEVSESADDVTKVGEEEKSPHVELPVDDVAVDDVITAVEPSPGEGEEGKKVRRRKPAGSKDGARRRTKSRDDSRKSGEVVAVEEVAPKEEGKLRVWWRVCKEVTNHWRNFASDEGQQRKKIASQRNRCVGSLMLMIIYVGLGAFIFRFTEGAFETFYKCGVKRVKRDFVDGLWSDSRSLSEEEWKSKARRRLMELEGQLQTAYDAGVTTYSGRRAWSFMNSIVYCLTVVTTIGYGHIAPATNTGRAITIVYAIFGIPMFLILLADFGKLFTRGIKFLWAFVRRVYYTGSCKKVRRTGPVQEVMKGVQLVYDFATFQRRPSQVISDGNAAGRSENQEPKMTTSASLGATLASPEGSASQSSLGVGTVSVTSVAPDSVRGGKNSIGAMPIHGFAGANDPGTPVQSSFEVDDEFNLPISVAIVILLGYIFVGATIYFSWEEWSFFESFYFVFISMSTIGFGDYVPQHPMYMMASIVYLVFGLALTSMCINVVQEKLSDSFRQASVKLGATIGLQVTEEEEAAMVAQKVELAEVHTAGKKQETT